MLERLALCLEMSPTALYVYAGRIPPQCQAVLESPRALAALEAGAMPEEWRRNGSRAVARPAARITPRPTRPVESRNAWAAARSKKPRAVRTPASGTPPDISDDLL